MAKFNPSSSDPYGNAARAAKAPFRSSLGAKHLGPKLGNRDMASAGLITDADRAARLIKAMPWVAPQSKAFVQSLSDYHASMGGWSPKQSVYVDRMLEAARDNYRRDKGLNGSASRKGDEPASSPRVSDAAMSALDRMFAAAKDAGVKPNKWRITLAQVNIVPDNRRGSGYALFRNGMQGGTAFMGTIMPGGVVDLRDATQAQSVADEISRAALDPGAYGREHKRCMFCAITLTDGRSRVKGYGPICAAKWNLPWGDETEASSGEPVKVARKRSAKWEPKGNSDSVNIVTKRGRTK